MTIRAALTAFALLCAAEAAAQQKPVPAYGDPGERSCGSSDGIISLREDGPGRYNLHFITLSPRNSVHARYAEDTQARLKADENPFTAVHYDIGLNAAGRIVKAETVNAIVVAIGQFDPLPKPLETLWIRIARAGGFSPMMPPARRTYDEHGDFFANLGGPGSAAMGMNEISQRALAAEAKALHRGPATIQLLQGNRLLVSLDFRIAPYAATRKAALKWARAALPRLKQGQCPA